MEEKRVIIDSIAVLSACIDPLVLAGKKCDIEIIVSKIIELTKKL